MKSNKVQLVLILIPLTICIGLFFFQNIYLKKQEEASKVQMYIAGEDIPAYTTITEDMIQPVTISDNSVLSSYVLDKETVIGKMTIGGVIKGEPITKQRLTDTKRQGEYVLRLEADSSNIIKVNDNVRVYVKLYNKLTQETKMTLLFENKKIIPLSEQEQTMVQNSSNGLSILNVYVTEKELEEYYIAKQSGSIVVVKIGELDVKDIQQAVDTFNPESQEAQESINQEAQDNLTEKATSLFTIQQEETSESMATLFKTTPEVIESLNEGKKVFQAGTQVVVPSY